MEVPTAGMLINVGTKVPMILPIVLKAFLNWLLILKLNMGIAGITLSTSFVTLFNATMLGLFMHRKIKLDYKSLFINFGKMLLAGVITFAAGLFICKYFAYVSLPKYVFEFVKIVVVMLACGVIYTVLNIVFKMEYASELLSRLKKKLNN